VLKTDELSVLKGQFVASLNHEFRTPLSGILGMSELLLETHLTEEQKEYVGASRLCAENLLEIFNSTLEFSALCANHIQLDETEFQVRETIEGVVAEFGLKASQKGLRLRHNLDRTLPATLVGDAMRIRQLLCHLVGNAIKFTEAGEVEVSASAKESGEPGGVLVTIRVRDTGIGIASEQLDTIFESFRQVETGLARNYPGLGLGLALAQKLAVLLRSELTVNSELGHGSIFAVALPLRLTPDAALDPTNFKRIRGRILVVDDNTMAQTIFGHILRRASYDVECVGNGVAAIDQASKFTFDIILMDLQMPGMDGYQTSKHIRALPAYAATPIIAVTANCSKDYRDLCHEQGIQGFLAKPVQPRELVSTVEKFLEASPAIH
jgi:CheY-like chemotaxis protein/anti-sigma regulatory factor (Ser/Thr protein kinase)